MRARSEQAVILTTEEAAFVRQALVASSGIFAQAKAAGGPRTPGPAGSGPGGPGRRAPPGQVHYDVCLAVDYLDFATPARSTR